MRLNGVSFENWLRSHAHKVPKERWLRELYPWPILAEVDCDEGLVGVTQRIRYGSTKYEATLRSIHWQPNHGTFKYRVFVESNGLGWHSRAVCDEYDMCGSPDGTFITLFHRKKQEPLEKIAGAFFSRRWSDLSKEDFKSLAVSRFLAASIVSEVAKRAYGEAGLVHYPRSRIAGGSSPMFASSTDLWLGFRFFSEDAFAWARRSAGKAARVVALYFADTKYQFRTDLPSSSSVRSVYEVDAELRCESQDLILALLRRLELPTEAPSMAHLEEIVRGRVQVSTVQVSESDVHEALAVLRSPCNSKGELRYQLAAGVVLNAWIESERRLGFVQRKRFYAFKQRIGSLMRWAETNPLPGVDLWIERDTSNSHPITFVRIDGVDFSFHAVPSVQDKRFASPSHFTWSGVRLKPIAPLVLRWARLLMDPGARLSSPHLAISTGDRQR